MYYSNTDVTWVHTQNLGNVLAPTHAAMHVRTVHHGATCHRRSINELGQP